MSSFRLMTFRCFLLYGQQKLKTVKYITDLLQQWADNTVHNIKLEEPYMDSLEHGLRRLIEVTLAWVPLLIGALLILIIGAMVASAISKGVRKLLNSMGLTERLYGGQGGSFIEKAVPDPERLVAKVVYWAIMLGVISLAVFVLGIPGLTAFVGAIYSYLPNILAALVIFLVAGAVAGGVSGFALRALGDTATGKLVGTVVPVIVMGIATFMILDQLMIAETIITITYAALIGGAALGLALAFGLGGRDVAARMLEGAYQKGMESRDQARADMQAAKARTQDAAQSVVNNARRRR
ncbi:hypothetical protein CYG49_00220 [Candidatus Saccharibacteria bacterium]|nr:MAG: hypothetical protein CYG49_00220 [Candidatus Saccharibacteria bacterium]